MWNDDPHQVARNRQEQRPWWSDAEHMRRLKEFSDKAVTEMQREHLERCYQLEIEKT